MLWYLPRWKTGDCGFYAFEDSQAGVINGQQPAIYNALYAAGARAGQFGVAAGGYPNIGSNNEVYTVNHISADFALAADDARAASDLTATQGWAVDYWLQHFMNYGMGFMHYGTAYSWGTAGSGVMQTMLSLTNSVPTFPNLVTNGGWLQNTVQFKVMNWYPDKRWDGARNTVWPGLFADTNGRPSLEGTPYMTTGYLYDPTFLFAPSSINASYLRYFMTNSTPGISWWGDRGAIGGNNGPLLVIDSPRIGLSDPSVLPHQYLFAANTSPAALSGWPSTACRGDTMLSRTGFSSTTDTFMLFQSRCWFGDHDDWQNGELTIYKAGELIGEDDQSGVIDGGNNGTNGTPPYMVVGNMLQFGGSTTNVPQGGYTNPPAPGTSPITSWASGNHGSWATAYGDQNSQYALACSNLTGAYTISFSGGYAQRCVAHMKPTSGDEFIIVGDFAKPASSTQIVTHWHYPQIPGNTATAYPGGNTTVAGGVVTELEDGGAAANGNPARTFGLVSRFLSPNPIAINDDGVSYSGGSGYAHRVSVCGGSSCGSSVGAYEVLHVHKIAKTLSDTTLSTTALNPDSHWTGVQASGAASTAVVMMARGATAQSSMTGFTTAFSGAGQYLFSGLAPGTYTVTLGGSPVAGSPFTVTAGDNTIEFTGGAGAVSLSGGGIASSLSTTVDGNASASGAVVIH